MINYRIEKALNEQVNAELYSSYLYLSMSSYFESISFKGFANWMRAQAQEELSHAMKFYDYIIERGGKVSLEKIDAPQKEWASPLKIFEDTYKHEQKVTALINALVDLAISEKDHATNNMLQWFVAEQVEEEANASEILDQLKMIGDEKRSLFMIDRELGQRVFKQ